MLLVLTLLLASCATPAPKDEPVILAPATFDAAVPEFHLPPTAEQKRRYEEQRREQRQQLKRYYAERTKRQRQREHQRRQREHQRRQREHQRCLAAHAAIDRCAEVRCKSYRLYMLWREVIATCP